MLVTFMLKIPLPYLLFHTFFFTLQCIHFIEMRAKFVKFPFLSFQLFLLIVQIEKKAFLPAKIA